MKVLVLLALVTMALAGSDWKITNNWQKLKAMESCWGEDNMKLHTVNIKKAIAKCSNEDAPELALAPYRSTYRFVNAMISGADQMEEEQEDNQKTELFEKMFNYMKEGHHGSRRHSSYKTYSRDNEDDSWMEKMKMKFFMKQMMENMMDEDSYETKSPSTYSKKSESSDIMDIFSKFFENNMQKKNYNERSDSESRKSFLDMFSRRSKRAASEDALANPNLDLGDRLVEKLNQQKHQMEAKVGNMTCVLKEMGCLNPNNEIDIAAMKSDMEQYTMPSPWFTERYEEILDTCYAMANNLPAEISENSVVSGRNFGTINLAQVKSFMKCCSKAKTQLCMNQDIKKKVEASFGPLEEILEQTQLTEFQLFPLVIQLLHGQEMEYMVGDF